MTHIVHINKMRPSKTFKSLKGSWEQNVLDFGYRQRGCQTGTHKTCSQETGSLTGGSFQSFLHQNKNCRVNSGIVLFVYLSLGFWFSLQWPDLLVLENAVCILGWVPYVFRQYSYMWKASVHWTLTAFVFIMCIYKFAHNPLVS